ncbi:hypothetical protein F4604DRAFT_1942321 [Suillus subluteus]|nr:hypothetical protein F4604DRAFT_1942321 [Suillus subluteus]
MTFASNLTPQHPKSGFASHAVRPAPYIPAPMEENKIGSKPLMLTKQACIYLIRQQHLQAEGQDKRDRIRLVFIPPDTPKVCLLNLMKVFTSDAI